MSRKSLYFSNTNKKTNYIDPKNVCLYSASLYSDSRRSSLMCLVPNMKMPSMARYERGMMDTQAVKIICNRVLTEDKLCNLCFVYSLSLGTVWPR